MVRSLLFDKLSGGVSNLNRRHLFWFNTPPHKSIKDMKKTFIAPEIYTKSLSRYSDIIICSKIKPGPPTPGGPEGTDWGGDDF